MNRSTTGFGATVGDIELLLRKSEQTFPLFLTRANSITSYHELCNHKLISFLLSR